MKIAMGQLNVKAGRPAENTARMKEMILAAKADHADLIVFPELSISGYLLADKWLDEDWCESLLAYNEEIRQCSQGIGIIWGNLGTLKGIKGRDGRKVRLNTAYFAYNGEWVKRENGMYEGMYVKYLNPDYRVFDDSRYFLSSLELCEQLVLERNFMTSPFLFNINGKEERIGIEICEDLWNGDYSFDPTRELLREHVSLIVNISSSPWTRNKEIGRSKQIMRHVQGIYPFVPFVYVNACGMQNNSKSVCVFDGDSTIWNKDGVVVSSCNDAFEEELKITELNESSVSIKTEHKLLKGLLCAIKEFDAQIFDAKVRWIIGLSGGLDSSISAALLAMALGEQRIIGLNMATRYNSSTTIDNAHRLADELGIECRDGVIQPLVESSVSVLKQYINQEVSEFALENIQARIRGSVLSAVSQIENGVIINNGNKVEMALGYCTLYGDTIGCIAPLGDVTKVELFELARSINAVCGKEVIPNNLLPEIIDDQLIWEMPPSAELKNNQSDPMKWFYHDLLIQRLCEYPAYQIESLMEDYLDGSIMEGEMGKWLRYYHLEEPAAFIEDLEWVLGKFSAGVFKRLQTPPIVMVSRGAFGSDFRENQMKVEKSHRYLQLKQQILDKPILHFSEPSDHDQVKYAVIMTRYQGKWIFVKAKDKSTYDIPGGKREENETIKETAVRELFEETGAVKSTCRPLFNYGVEQNGEISWGQLFYAEAEELELLPAYEIESILMKEGLPKKLTYPAIQPYLYRKTLAVLKEEYNGSK